MSDTFEYTHTYVLDKSHFSETYDASKVQIDTQRQYLKAVAMALFGLAILYLTEISPYIAWFLVAIAGLEALSVRFHKAWWLGRQLISKAANNHLTLTINEQGIAIHSNYVNNLIGWDQIQTAEKTEKGWLLFLSKGKSYISDRCLSNEAQSYLQGKLNAVS